MHCLHMTWFMSLGVALLERMTVMQSSLLVAICEILCETFVCVFVCVQDYPSIGQVLFQMETFDVSVIFAVRDTHQNTYEVRTLKREAQLDL